MSVTVAGLPGVRAAIFDFNGTITDDEQLQYEIYAELCDEALGLRLDRDVYFTELAGRSDPEIVETLLERTAPAGDVVRDRFISERVRRYTERVRHRPPIRPGTAALIRALRGRVPLAVTTGAFRAEVDLILSAGNLADAFDAIVTIEDVSAGKPDPEGFARALDLLNRARPGDPPDRAAAATPGSARLEPADVVVFEDSPYGIEAAHAAGMRCVAAHLTTEVATAETVVDVLGPELLAGP
jgi:beta-phosphoglucomutase-like phosphatase (HAD superfamily)